MRNDFLHIGKEILFPYCAKYVGYCKILSNEESIVRYCKILWNEAEGAGQTPSSVTIVGELADIKSYQPLTSYPTTPHILLFPN